MEDFEERKKMFGDLKAELFKRQVSNSENFDKSVLAYATAALGFSLAFLKDFVPITAAAFAMLLYVSWGLFTLTISLRYSRFSSVNWASPSSYR